MKVQLLSAEEVRQSGFTHIATVDHTDLTAAALTQSLELVTGLPDGTLITAAAVRVPTVFAGGALSSLTIQLGWSKTTGSDADGLIEAAAVLGGSAIKGTDATGAAFATKRTGFYIDEATDIDLLFTGISANVVAATSGELVVYLSLVNLDDFRP